MTDDDVARRQDVGRRVALWRRRRRLTRKQFADLCGRSPSWVDKIEPGDRGLLRLPMLERVADVLKASVEALTNAEQASAAAINKLAAGISDTYALGLLTEAVGAGLPLVLAPSLNGPGGYEPAPPGTGGRPYPWDLPLRTLRDRLGRHRDQRCGKVWAVVLSFQDA